MIRSLLLGAVVTALVALSAAPALAAPGARTAAATCPGTFTVLHADHIGSVPFPAGQYRIATNQLSCATASQLFSRFLEDYDGVIRDTTRNLEVFDLCHQCRSGGTPVDIADELLVEADQGCAVEGGCIDCQGSSVLVKISGLYS